MNPNELEDAFDKWEPQRKLKSLSEQELGEWSSAATVMTLENLVLPVAQEGLTVINMEDEEFGNHMKKFVVDMITQTSDHELLKLANGIKNVIAVAGLLFEEINAVVGDRMAAKILTQED